MDLVRAPVKVVVESRGRQVVDVDPDVLDALYRRDDDLLRAVDDGREAIDAHVLGRHRRRAAQVQRLRDLGDAREREPRRTKHRLVDRRNF